MVVRWVNIGSPQGGGAHFTNGCNVKLPSHFLLVMQAAGQAGGEGDSDSIGRWREGVLDLYCW